MKKLLKVLIWFVSILAGLELIGIVLSAIGRHIPSHTVLSLRLEGSVPEQPARNSVIALLQGQPLTMTRIIRGLDQARLDPHISGLVVHLGEPDIGMAKLEELRDGLQQFNRSGKFTVAYLDDASNSGYYLASACRTVMQQPGALLDVRGMMASTTFLRGAFDKLGIVPNFFHIGAYKNATNQLTEKKFTPEHREATEALLEDWYNQFLKGVAESRHLPLNQVQSLVMQGPFTSAASTSKHLVDRVAYADEEKEAVRRKNGGYDRRLSLREYLRRHDTEGKTRLAVIYASGTIMSGRSGDGGLGDSVLGADTIADQFRSARQDDSLRAVILRVNSPGGSATASEAIRRELELTRKVKPVVVSMSDVAASGGYWISMSASRIVAEPGTITGSIGVLAGKFNLAGLYAKLGISSDYVATAPNATMEYPLQDYTPQERAAIEDYMQQTYGQFISGVAQGRHLSVEAVDKIGQGRVWSGERARQLGLVDRLGGIDTAIDEAKRLAGIPGGQRVELVVLPPPKSFLESVSDLLNGQTRVQALAPLQWLSRLQALGRTAVWALLPAIPQVQ